MALPRTTLRKAGRLELTIYDFAEAGDELPVHVHDETHNHISFVARGDFRITGDSAINGTIVSIGDVIDWPANQRHGFVALTHRARMVQVPK